MASLRGAFLNSLGCKPPIISTASAKVSNSSCGMKSLISATWNRRVSSTTQVSSSPWVRMKGHMMPKLNQFQQCSHYHSASSINLLRRRVPLLDLLHTGPLSLSSKRSVIVDPIQMSRTITVCKLHHLSSSNWTGGTFRIQGNQASVGGGSFFTYCTSSTPPPTNTTPSKEPEATLSANKTKPSNDEGVEVIYFRGLPQITVPLPSRRERCRFIVKPLTNTVSDLLRMIQTEDKGVDRIAFLSTDGTRIATSNTIEMLMEHDFDMIINDNVYRVITPPQEKPSQEDLTRLSSVRNLVGQLYGALNVDEHQLRHEREMLIELEKLKNELGPLEDKREHINQLALKRTNYLTWVGLGLMSVQFGILARLTWWEYSWDIMEPVTYFVTYGTAMLAYAYFVLTKQEYVLPAVTDRQYLITFHKNAKKVGLDVDKYNSLKDKIHKIETDLLRLRDPLALHLPLKNRLVTKAELDNMIHDMDAEVSQSIVSKATQKFTQMFKKPS